MPLAWLQTPRPTVLSNARTNASAQNTFPKYFPLSLTSKRCRDRAGTRCPKSRLLSPTIPTAQVKVHLTPMRLQRNDRAITPVYGSSWFISPHYETYLRKKKRKIFTWRDSTNILNNLNSFALFLIQDNLFQVYNSIDWESSQNQFILPQQRCKEFLGQATQSLAIL